MSVRIIPVFSGNSPNGLVETQPVTSPSFYFIDVNGGNGDNYEIAASLKLSLVSTEIIGGFPITTSYGAKELPVPIDIVDTSQITVVPCETYPAQLDVSLCLVFAYSVNITVYAAVTNQTIGNSDEFQFEDIVERVLRELLPSVLRLILPPIVGEIVGIGIEILLPILTGDDDVVLLPGIDVPLLPGN